VNRGTHDSNLAHCDLVGHLGEAVASDKARASVSQIFVEVAEETAPLLRGELLIWQAKRDTAFQDVKR
jgi:hypothetical protein